MMRKLLVTISILMFSTTGLAQTTAQEPNDSEGEVRYITDDLYTFMHAGPGKNYRILGSVQAGTEVIQLQIDEDRGFIEVIDPKQRTGWVEAEFITREKSVREQIPDLQAEIRQANETIQAQRSNNQALSQQIAQLQSHNSELTTRMNDVQKQNNEMSFELARKDKSTQMEWLTRGAIIALVGIVLGVIIAYLPKKRKRNDEWA